jgi:hypothetical protein
MNEAQVSMLLAANRATYVKTQGDVQWWKLPSGEWVGKRALPGGLFEVRRFSANACGC